MTNAPALILAIDLGTSGVKTAVVASDGNILSRGYTRIETILLPDGGAEQDPECVWRAVLSACKQALHNIEHPQTICGVAVDSQFSSIIPVDRDLRPTMNMVMWMDKRGAPDALKKIEGGKQLVAGPLRQLKWVRIHGIPPLDSGADSLAHMRWIKLARPEVYERTVAFLEPMDFLTARFTGRATTNPCSAFLMLLVDNRKLEPPRYAPALLRLSGIDAQKLPELIPVEEEVGTVRPEVARELGIPATARVLGGINDTHAGSFGAFALTGSHAGISVGTTSVMVTHVGWKRTDIGNAIVSMPSAVPGDYLITAENGIGGRAIEFFLKKIVFAADGFADHSLENEFAVLHRAIAEVEPGSGGVLFLPWLAGSLSPSEDGRVRGGFLNMSLDTTRAHLGRAVLEGVAFNFRWLKSAVEKFCKRKLTHLVFYGGGAVSDDWAQIFADIMQLPVHQVEDPRYTLCRGVALYGFYRMGLVGLDDLASRVPIKNVYEPEKTLQDGYDLMFEQFVQAFRKNRRIFHALNG